MIPLPLSVALELALMHCALVSRPQVQLPSRRLFYPAIKALKMRANALLALVMAAVAYAAPCEDWCANDVHTWEQKCGTERGAWIYPECYGCSQCSDPKVTNPENCDAGCAPDTNTWTYKCAGHTDADFVCTGCATCGYTSPHMPPSPPPILENTAQGQITYLGGAAVFLLIIAVVRPLLLLAALAAAPSRTLTHCSNPLTARRPTRFTSGRSWTRAPSSAGRTPRGPRLRARCARESARWCASAPPPLPRTDLEPPLLSQFCSFRGPLRAQAKFFVSWVCIESGLGVLVQILNALATAQAASDGSPVPFYFACALNVLMIVLETSEIRRTRKHGGVQTPWDRFWFGQWIGSTPKNFYAKYTSRVLLGCEFYLNMTALPVMIVATQFVSRAPNIQAYLIGEARMAKVRDPGQSNPATWPRVPSALDGPPRSFPAVSSA